MKMFILNTTPFVVVIVQPKCSSFSFYLDMLKSTTNFVVDDVFLCRQAQASSENSLLECVICF